MDEGGEEGGAEEVEAHSHGRPMIGYFDRDIASQIAPADAKLLQRTKYREHAKTHH